MTIDSYPPYRSGNPPTTKWLPPTPPPAALPIETIPFPSFTLRQTQDINSAGSFGAPQAVGVPTGGALPQGFPDAPWDGSTYGRNNGLWSNVIDCGEF